MNKTLTPDPFWDINSGVRCSSVGDDADRYHDPSTQSLESRSRPISNTIPAGKNGIKGVIIPRANILGGSRGFDPHKPRLVNIDPDIEGQSCVVDLSQITREKMDEAIAKASENPRVKDDIRLLASQTYHNLAVGYEPVGMGSRSARQEDDNKIIGMKQKVSQFLAPQEVMSPSVTSRARAALTNESSKQIEMRASQNGHKEEQSSDYPVAMFSDQTKMKLANKLSNPSKLTSNTRAPATTITFVMKGWGSFEASYHEVIKNGNLLVLAYDTSFKSGMRFAPPITEELMGVRIGDSDEVFYVHSTGAKFNHNGYDYCILVIDQPTEYE